MESAESWRLFITITIVALAIMAIVIVRFKQSWIRGPEGNYTFSLPISWPWFAGAAALVLFILFWRMGGETAATTTTFKDNNGKEMTRQTRPVFDAKSLYEKFVIDGPIKRGWEIMPDKVSLSYNLPEGELYGPEVFTGLNVALLGPGEKVEALFPMGSFNFCAHIGDSSSWKEIGRTDQTIFKSELWTALMLKGDATRDPGKPFQVNAWIKHSAAPYLRIQTCKILNPEEDVCEWGVLPDKSQFNWEMYVRFADPKKGLNIPMDVLAKEPGGITVGDDYELFPWAENNFSAKRAKPGEKLLRVVAPNIPGGTRVEVILLITPKY